MSWLIMPPVGDLGLTRASGVLGSDRNVNWWRGYRMIAFRHMAVAAPQQDSVVSGRTRQVLLGACGVGAVAFLFDVGVGDGTRAWTALLVNFLFFAGLAQAGVVLSAVMQATSARWGRSLKRLAEATAAFLPAAFVLLLVLFLGIATWAPWVREPVEAKTAWLNIPFFVTRQTLTFLLLSGLSLAYVYRSLRPDIGMLDESGEQKATGFARRLIGGWQGSVEERLRNQRFQGILAPCVLIAYAWVFSLVAFDFVMALDPHWFSTLAGGYYFIGNLFLGIAFLAVAAVWARDRLGIRDYIGDHQLHDIGKLLFGFCILWAYMLWSQYLVIWYGDLPEETQFIAHRMQGSWAPLTWIVLALAFFIPFAVLLSREVKTQVRGLTTVSLVVLVGMWLERFILVTPSIWRGDGLPLGILEILITAGVFSLFAWCYITFLQTFPVLPVSDPRLTRVTEHWLPPPISQRTNAQPQ